MTGDHDARSATYHPARLSRLAARPRRAHHDRGAPPRQLDALSRSRRRSAFAWAMIARRLRRAAVPVPRRRRGVAVGRLEAATDRATSRAASRAVVRRGLEIFGLAFLFRLQAWILSWSSPWTLLKVDILNIMGPRSWPPPRSGAPCARRAARLVGFAAATLAIDAPDPDRPRRSRSSRRCPIRSRPTSVPLPTLSNFVFFPVGRRSCSPGRFVGVLLDAVRRMRRERRPNLRLRASAARDRASSPCARRSVRALPAFVLLDDVAGVLLPARWAS